MYKALGREHRAVWIAVVSLFLGSGLACESRLSPSGQKQRSPHRILEAQQAIRLEDLAPEDRAALRRSVEDKLRRTLREELRAEFAQSQRDRCPACPSCPAELSQGKDSAEQATSAQGRERKRQQLELQNVENDERGMRVLKQICSTGIQRRQPVDNLEQFDISDGSVYCFVEIFQELEAERNITIKFVHSTGLTQSYDLPVGQSSAWRTWSKLNLTRSMVGRWLCEVYNEDGTLLSRRAFIVSNEG